MSFCFLDKGEARWSYELMDGKCLAIDKEGLGASPAQHIVSPSIFWLRQVDHINDKMTRKTLHLMELCIC